VSGTSQVKKPLYEHSVPFLWPLAAGIELGEKGLAFFQESLNYVVEAQAITAPPPPQWATDNRVALELDTMQLRDFSPHAGSASCPVIVDAPYAGHMATIVDYARGQSLVEVLLASGLERVFVTDWKAATDEMRYFDIDKYLAEINVAVDDLGGRVHLIGLCQGGWMSTMYAARFPENVRSLVLAGAPIDTDAGDGPIKQMAHSLPLSFYKEMVVAGGGRMRGDVMLAGWKNMHPEKQYFGKYLDLLHHIEDKSYIARTETFERWYENPIDLPGTYYLQAIGEIFKENRFARGQFVGLGRRLDLKNVKVPVYLLAGDADDVTTSEQVFNAERLLGTPADRVVKTLAPGGHIGLFMGTKTLAAVWPEIGRWVLRQ
jgi:poly(3-hydroxybutyrate) depolymerase